MQNVMNLQSKINQLETQLEDKKQEMQELEHRLKDAEGNASATFKDNLKNKDEIDKLKAENKLLKEFKIFTDKLKSKQKPSIPPKSTSGVQYGQLKSEDILERLAGEDEDSLKNNRDKI